MLRFATDRRLATAFALCGLLALAAVWLPHYPLGVDLPQHANLFRLWADLANGPFEYRATYYIDWFTPYLLPYAVALPLTKLFGALFATKCLLTFMVCATPLFLSRWLKAIGADPAFGLIGFVVVFDYAYIWGFVSCAVAIPLMFAYLGEFEKQGDRPSFRQILVTTLIAVVLFFSHGITFAVSVVVAMLIWLLRGRWLSRWRAAAHVVPLTLLTGSWIALRHTQSSAHAVQDWFDWPRAINLFSGAFMPFPDNYWAIVAAAGVGIFLLLARPKLAFTPSRIVPLAVVLVAFVALPDWLASAWLVGSRFCVFVHAFAPAALVPRTSDRVARQWRVVLFALVAAFLVVLNVRLQGFNRELAGLREVAALIPAGADVETLVPETDSTSKVFGGSEFGQVPAWVTAEQGGLIANDSAVAGYYQIPIRRKNVPLFEYYPYIIAHGDYASYRGRLRSLSNSAAGPARLVKRSGSWLLLKRPTIEAQDFSVVRYGQGWGELRVDQTVSGPGLSIAHVGYAHGLGTHAKSLIRIHFKHPGTSFAGACGVDDAAGRGGHATFRIRDSDGGVLFDSGAMVAGTPARTFSVALKGASELVLEADAEGKIDYAHADWVDLTLH